MTKKSLWQNILDRLSQGWQAITGSHAKDPRDSVDFSISFISLAAKLAKADGQVTRDEVIAFRQIFVIAPEEEANAARVFNLCRETTAGYESHANRMGKLIQRSPDPEQMRSDVMEALFVIAMADDVYHVGEDAFLRGVKKRIGMSDAAFDRILASHVPECACPYTVLGVDETATLSDVRAARRMLIKEYHPDRIVARGLPEEMVRLGAERLTVIEKAYKDLVETFRSSNDPVLACDM
jgi:DnaJ like chaperone protein